MNIIKRLFKAKSSNKKIEEKQDEIKNNPHQTSILYETFAYPIDEETAGQIRKLLDEWPSDQ